MQASLKNKFATVAFLILSLSIIAKGFDCEVKRSDDDQQKYFCLNKFSNFLGSNLLQTEDGKVLKITNDSFADSLAYYSSSCLSGKSLQLVRQEVDLEFSKLYNDSDCVFSTLIDEDKRTLYLLYKVNKLDSSVISIELKNMIPLNPKSAH
jgi:hypothetical protein